MWHLSVIDVDDVDVVVRKAPKLQDNRSEFATITHIVLIGEVASSGDERSSFARNIQNLNNPTSNKSIDEKSVEKRIHLGMDEGGITFRILFGQISSAAQVHSTRECQRIKAGELSTVT